MADPQRDISYRVWAWPVGILLGVVALDGAAGIAVGVAIGVAFGLAFSAAGRKGDADGGDGSSPAKGPDRAA